MGTFVLDDKYHSFLVFHFILEFFALIKHSLKKLRRKQKFHSLYANLWKILVFLVYDSSVVCDLSIFVIFCRFLSISQYLLIPHTEFAVEHYKIALKTSRLRNKSRWCIIYSIFYFLIYGIYFSFQKPRKSINSTPKVTKRSSDKNCSTPESSTNNSFVNKTPTNAKLNNSISRARSALAKFSSPVSYFYKYFNSL